MSERAAPFYCPYCGDEGLRPFGETHGQWRCEACQRAFTLKYQGAAPNRPLDTEPEAKAP